MANDEDTLVVKHNGFEKESAMSQDAEKVIDHFELFRGSEYTEMLANKKSMFEDPVPAEELARVAEWTKSKEYCEKNFARECLTINPAKACQPLGAVFASLGFEGTLPLDRKSVV